MSALGKLVVSLALNHAEYTQGLSRSDQAALKFAQNSQRQFDRAERAAKQAFRGVALGAAGLVTSFISVNASLSKVKGIIDAQDQLGKLSQKTGLAVESLAGLDFAATQSGTNLDRAAKGIRGFSRIIADSSGAPNKFTEILTAMGVEIDALKNKSPEEQFLALADAVQGLGEQDRAVAITSLLGDRMADLVPLLSGGSERLRDLIAEGQRYNPVTAESAARAELFNDNLDRLSRSAGSLAQQLTIGLVSSLSDVTAEMAEAAEQSGILHAVWVGLSSLSPVSQFGQLFAGNVDNQKFDDFIKNRKGILEFKATVDELGDEADETGTKVETLAEIIARLTEQFSQAGKGGTQLTKTLTAEEREVESLERDIKRLTAAYDPLIARNERLARLNQKLALGLPRDIFEAEAIKAITQAEDAINGVGVAVDEVVIAEEDLRFTSRSVFGDIDQFATQAFRNMQTHLAQTIYEMKFSLRGFVDIGKRLLAELSSAAILSGFASMFRGGTFAQGFSSTFASNKSGGGGGLGSNLFNGASLLSTGRTIYQGFTGGLLSSGASAIGTIGETLGIQAFSSFSSAFSGAATSGVFGPGGVGYLAGGGIGAGSTAGTQAAVAAGKEFSAAQVAGVQASSSAATAATGFGLLALATSIGNSLVANNKKVGGLSSSELNSLDSTFDSFAGFVHSIGAFGTGLTYTKLIGEIPGIGGFLEKTITPFIPDLGAITTFLFGHGAPKLKETNLIGQATGEGFSGVASSKIKQEGGAFVSDIVKRVILDVDTLELSDGSTRKFGDFADSLKPSIDLLNFTLDGALVLMNENLGKTSELLGLGSTAGFSTDINIASQKGQFFTAEEVTAELQRVEEEFIRHVVPSIDILRQGGETVIDTFQRIGNEFNILTGLGNALNNSTQVAQEFLRNFDPAGRSSLINQLGGVEAVAQFSDFFANNFLTESERLKISTDNLATSLRDAGFAADLSRDQYAALVKSFGTDGGITASELNSLREIGPNLVAIRDATANNAFGALSRSVAAEQQDIASSIGFVVERMNDLSGVLQLTGNAINTIFPIGKSQARSLIGRAANDKDFDNPQLSNAIAALTKSSTAGFPDRLAFLRDQAASANSLRELENAASDQLSLEEQTLSALEVESAHLSGILSNAQLQLDALNGIKELLSVGDAKSAFDAAVSGGGGGNGAADSLRALAATGASNLALYRAAKVSGIQGGFDAAVSALGFSRADGAQFLRDTGLPGFASGGAHSGGLRLVGENGPELEFTGPSRIVSNSDTKKMLDNSDITALLEKLLKAVESGNITSGELLNRINKVTPDRDAVATRAAA